jgi:ElaB/YqjD/DUF883 family membrane-anchored ribosome-binding protein
MDQERNEVRQVDDARRRVAEDVRSVAENANVVERAKETAQSKIDDVKSTVGERMQQVRESARNINIPMNASDNPIGMLIAGAAVGFLIGLALPVSRFESERIGPLAQDMKSKAREAGSEVMRRGGEVIKETISAGREAASSSIKEQTREMGLGGSDQPQA